MVLEKYERVEGKTESGGFIIEDTRTGVRSTVPPSYVEKKVVKEETKKEPVKFTFGSGEVVKTFYTVKETTLQDTGLVEKRDDGGKTTYVVKESTALQQPLPPQTAQPSVQAAGVQPAARPQKNELVKIGAAGITVINSIPMWFSNFLDTVSERGVSYFKERFFGEKTAHKLTPAQEIWYKQTQSVSDARAEAERVMSSGSKEEKIKLGVETGLSAAFTALPLLKIPQTAAVAIKTGVGTWAFGEGVKKIVTGETAEEKVRGGIEAGLGAVFLASASKGISYKIKETQLKTTGAKEGVYLESVKSNLKTDVLKTGEKEAVSQTTGEMFVKERVIKVVNVGGKPAKVDFDVMSKYKIDSVGKTNILTEKELIKISGGEKGVSKTLLIESRGMSNTLYALESVKVTKGAGIQLKTDAASKEFASSFKSVELVKRTGHETTTLGKTFSISKELKGTDVGVFPKVVTGEAIPGESVNLLKTTEIKTALPKKITIGAENINAVQTAYGKGISVSNKLPLAVSKHTVSFYEKTPFEYVQQSGVKTGVLKTTYLSPPALDKIPKAPVVLKTAAPVKTALTPPPLTEAKIGSVSTKNEAKAVEKTVKKTDVYTPSETSVETIRTTFFERGFLYKTPLEAVQQTKFAEKEKIYSAEKELNKTLQTVKNIQTQKTSERTTSYTIPPVHTPAPYYPSFTASSASIIPKSFPLMYPGRKGSREKNGLFKNIRKTSIELYKPSIFAKSFNFKIKTPNIFQKNIFRPLVGRRKRR